MDLEEEADEDDVIEARIHQHIARQQNRVRVQRRYWIRPWIQRRGDFGHYNRLMKELENEDRQSFNNFLRMPLEMFREIEQRLEASSIKACQTVSSLICTTCAAGLLK